MKTAIKVLMDNDCYQTDHESKDGRIISSQVTRFEQAMKEYGRRCAEQALKDAAEHFDMEANRHLILSTPIITP